MANLLDTDFGSESEGENFNPAPTVGSDDEDLGESDNEVTVRPKSNGANSSRKNTLPDVEEKDTGRPGVGGSMEQARGAGNRRPDEELDDEDEEGGMNGHTKGANGLDDDDEDEDDEDEEDAVKVGLARSSNCIWPLD